MALGSLERGECSDPSFTKLLAQGVLHGAGVPGESTMFLSVLDKTTCSRESFMALVSLERGQCSDPSFTNLLAQGALHDTGVPGESVLF